MTRKGKFIIILSSLVLVIAVGVVSVLAASNGSIGNRVKFTGYLANDVVGSVSISGKQYIKNVSSDLDVSTHEFDNTNNYNSGYSGVETLVIPQFTGQGIENKIEYNIIVKNKTEINADAYFDLLLTITSLKNVCFIITVNGEDETHTGDIEEDLAPGSEIIYTLNSRPTTIQPNETLEIFITLYTIDDGFDSSCVFDFNWGLSNNSSYKVA